MHGVKAMILKVALEASDEGGFTVSVPSLPGCISEGETREEALTHGCPKHFSSHLKGVPSGAKRRKARSGADGPHARKARRPHRKRTLWSLRMRTPYLRPVEDDLPVTRDAELLEITL